MSARKIGFLILILGFGAAVETSWSIRESRVFFGPEGCRVLGGRFYGPSFTFEETTEAPLPEGEIPRVEVRNEFGDVVVATGEGPGLRVRLRKVVYQPTEEKAREFASGIELRLDSDGERLRVGTNRDEVGRGRHVGFETHLEVTAPPAVTVDVRNEHGAVEVRGVAGAKVRTSFGDTRIEDVTGAVSLETRHGAVHAEKLGAALTIDARHGDVTLGGVAGSADLKVEHGSVTARGTAGLSARVSFGGFTAEGVGGDLTVRSSHGAVSAADVTGRADAETSFAGIELRRVGKDARTKSQHGAVVASAIGGAFTAQTSHGRVELERVEGPVEVRVENGAVEARSLRKGALLRASGGDVSIDGFEGPIDVAVERGDVRLLTSAPIVESLSASATGGGIRLEVPAGSRFELEAESRHGELHMGLPGSETIAADAGGRSRATATVGGGGAQARVIADGDVAIEPHSPALAEAP